MALSCGAIVAPPSKNTVTELAMENQFCSIQNVLGLTMLRETEIIRDETFRIKKRKQCGKFHTSTASRFIMVTLTSHERCMQPLRFGQRGPTTFGR